MDKVWFGLFGDKQKAREGFAEADKKHYIKEKIEIWYRKEGVIFRGRKEVEEGKQKKLF